MKTLTALFVMVLLTAKTTNAQPAIQWQKSLGGASSDVATSVQQTTDGGYIVAGRSQSTDGDITGNHGAGDYWIVKLNNAGALQWQKSLGGTAIDEAFSIKQTSDGGYIVAGYTKSSDGDVTGYHGVNNDHWDCWVVKLTSAGALQWQKALGGTGDDVAYSVQQTSDGGYIVAGFSNSPDGDVTGNHGNDDYWIVKLTSAGELQWQKSLGGTGDDIAYSVQQTTDGGYIVTGGATGDVTGNHGGTDYWVVKLNSAGALQWQKSLGGTRNDIAITIQQTGDGGYILAGYSDSPDGDVTGNHGNDDYWIVKLTSAGELQWQKSFGGTGVDLAISMQQTSNGSYIVTGYSNSPDGDVTGNHGAVDYWVVKLDNAGALQWKKTLGGTGDDAAYSIQQTTDGGYVMAGQSASTNGDVTGNHGNADFWIVKLAPDISAVDEPLAHLPPVILYPNPARARLTVQTTGFAADETVMAWVLNALGQHVGSGAGAGTFPVSCHVIAGAVTIDISRLPAGAYFLQLQGTRARVAQRFVKE